MALKDSKYIMEVFRTCVNSVWWDNSGNKACTSQNKKDTEMVHIISALLAYTYYFPLIRHVILSSWHKDDIVCKVSAVIMLPIRPCVITLWVNVHGGHRTVWQSLLYRMSAIGYVYILFQGLFHMPTS